jgi:hypothetical protein
MPLHHEQAATNGRTVGVKPSSKPNGTNGHTYHQRRPAPFDEAIDALSANGYSGLAVVRKRPIDEQWERWCSRAPTMEEIASRKGRRYNVGVACGFGGTAAIDIDTDRPEVIEAISRVVQSPVAKRGKRGLTLIGRTSKPIASQRFHNPDGEILVEVLGDGRQTVIPFSIHPDTDKPYEWVGPATLLNTPLADLQLWPDDIGERLRKELAPFLPPEKAPQPERSGPPPILTDTMRKRHRAWALKAIGSHIKELAAKQEPGRGDALFKYACTFGKHVHHGIVTDAEMRKPALAASETNGFAKKNGWHDCEKTIDNGLRYALSDVLEDLPERPRGQTSRKGKAKQLPDVGKFSSEAQEQAEADPLAELAAEPFDTNEEGRITKGADNIRRCLAKAGIRLSYNAFARQRLIHGLDEYGPDLTDAAIDAMWIGFEREYRVRFTREHFNAVVRVEAHTNTFHPVRDYLAKLKWDGEPRLDKWLVTYAGAADTKLTQQFGRLTLIGAVRRVRQPGSKFDTMLVLEGPEGRNKSTLFETLASSDWFSDDAPLNAEARETIERLRGKWIIEAADLAAVRRTDVERLKAFLTRKADEATMKYERENTKAPRACIFVGTTNNSEYLQSKTGNRRFWPVKVGKIDIAALRRDRDQLWAEAAHYEELGASTVLPEDLWTSARQEQEDRRESDAWEDAIAGYLEERRRLPNPLVTSTEVAQQVLSLQLRDLDGRLQARITDAMRLAGWSRDAGKKVRGVRYWGPVEGQNND